MTVYSFPECSHFEHNEPEPNWWKYSHPDKSWVLHCFEMETMWLILVEKGLAKIVAYTQHGSPVFQPTVKTGRLPDKCLMFDPQVATEYWNCK